MLFPVLPPSPRWLKDENPEKLCCSPRKHTHTYRVRLVNAVYRFSPETPPPVSNVNIRRELLESDMARVAYQRRL